MKVVAAQAVVLDMQNRTERIVGAATVRCRPRGGAGRLPSGCTGVDNVWKGEKELTATAAATIERPAMF